MEQTQSLLSIKAINSFGEHRMTEPKLIQHHEKYLEIHGKDKIVLMTRSEHDTLHKRLRRNGNCKIPVDILSKLSQKAHKRISQRISFQETIMRNVFLVEEIKINTISNQISGCSYFRIRAKHKRELDRKYEEVHQRIMFRDIIDTNVLLFETIGYNNNTGNIDISSGFSSNHGVKLYRFLEE